MKRLIANVALGGGAGAAAGATAPVAWDFLTHPRQGGRWSHAGANPDVLAASELTGAGAGAAIGSGSWMNDAHKNNKALKLRLLPGAPPPAVDLTGITGNAAITAATDAHNARITASTAAAEASYASKSKGLLRRGIGGAAAGGIAGFAIPYGFLQWVMPHLSNHADNVYNLGDTYSKAFKAINNPQ